MDIDETTKKLINNLVILSKKNNETIYSDISNLENTEKMNFKLIFKYLLELFKNDEESNIVKMNIIYLIDSILNKNVNIIIEKYIESDLLYYLDLIAKYDKIEEDNDLLFFYYNDEYFDNENNKKTYELLIEKFLSWYYKFKNNYPIFNNKINQIKKNSEYLNILFKDIEESTKIFDNYWLKFKENLNIIMNYYLKEIIYQDNKLINEKLKHFNYLNNININKLKFTADITNDGYYNIINSIHGFINSLKDIKSEEIMYNKIEYQIDILKNILSFIENNDYLSEFNTQISILKNIISSLKNEKEENQKNWTIEKIIDKKNSQIDKNIIINDNLNFSNQDVIKPNIVHITKNPKKIIKKELQITEEDLEYNIDCLKTLTSFDKVKRPKNDYKMDEDEMINFYMDDIQSKTKKISLLKSEYFSKINMGWEYDEEYITNVKSSNKLVSILNDLNFENKDNFKEINTIIKENNLKYKEIIENDKNQKFKENKNFKEIKKIKFLDKISEINNLKIEIQDIKKNWKNINFKIQEQDEILKSFKI